MKLLEETTSTPAPRPSGRRVLATMSITLLVVVGATFLGYAMLTASGDDDTDENSPVELTAWVEEASTNCVAVAEEYSILTQGTSARVDPDNIPAVNAGVSALVSGVDDLPALQDAEEEGQVREVVELGTSVNEAWQELEAADEASDDALAEASELTSTYIGGLVDLGADCGVLN